MDVTSTSSTTAGKSTASTTTSAAKTATVDYNSFLKLLIAQMKNQDPTKPTDPAQYLGQLASFSSVEQQVQTNSKLDALATNSMLSQADGVIGRTLTSADGATSGKVTSVTLTSSGLQANLDGGGTIAVGSGVRVS